MCAEPIPLAGKGEERAEGDSVGSRQLVHETNARPSAARARAKKRTKRERKTDKARSQASIPPTDRPRCRSASVFETGEQAWWRPLRTLGSQVRMTRAPSLHEPSSLVFAARV